MPLSRNLGTLTSWNPLGLSGPVMGLLYLYLFTYLNEGFLDYWPKSILSQNLIGVLPLSLSFAYPVLNFPSEVNDVILFPGYSPVTPVLKQPANNSH